MCLSFLNDIKVGDYLNLALVLITGFYAYLTAKLVKENAEMRKAQTEPNIEIIAETIHKLIRLRVSNLGPGAAKNVSFKVIEFKGRESMVADFMETKFLTNGVRYFSTSQVFYSGFTEILKNTDEKLNSILKIEVSYEKINGESRKSIYEIDFSMFKGTYSFKQPLEYIEDQLKLIAQKMK